MFCVNYNWKIFFKGKIASLGFYLHLSLDHSKIQKTSWRLEYQEPLGHQATTHIKIKAVLEFWWIFIAKFLWGTGIFTEDGSQLLMPELISWRVHTTIF